MEVKKEEDGCGAMIGGTILLAAIYSVGALLLQYVLGGFGVHVSYLLALTTFFLVKVIK